MSNIIRTLSTAVALTALFGCTPPGQTSPARSPTGDNEPPATTTGNGEVLGADREPPGQKLEEGVKVDAKDGVKPAEKPGE